MFPILSFCLFAFIFPALCHLNAAPVTDLDSAQYHLFLITGQSNSQGYLGPKNEGLNEPIPSLPPGSVYYFSPPDSIRDASNATPKEYVGAQAGFHNEFAREYARRTGKKVILIHEVHGNSGIVPGQRYSGGNWPDKYRGDLKKQYESFKTAAAGNPEFAGKWALAGMIWGQGEAEMGLLQTGRKSLPELEKDLSNLFDRFSEDYLADYGGDKARFINLALVSIFAYRSVENDRFYPDSPAWAATRELQRHVAQSHPHARMVYFPTERFYLDGVWQPNNSVHYTQKQYNEMGRVMAQEIAEPGSTIRKSQPPRGLTAAAEGPWRVRLQWEAPEGGIPGELPCYRIYRKTGENDWEWIWQNSKEALKWSDENHIIPGTTYQYRVSARNEFGEAFSETVSLTAETLPADPAASSGYPAAAALWQELQKANLTEGLRALYLAGEQFGVKNGVLANLVREAKTPGRYDLTYGGGAGEPNSYAGVAVSGSGGLVSGGSVIPINGPYTILMDVTLAPQGSGPFLEQGTKAESGDLNPWTGLSFHDKEGEIRFAGDTQIRGIKSGRGSMKAGQPARIAFTYDGLHAAIRIGEGLPKRDQNTIYFGAVQDGPLRLGGYGSADQPGRFHYLAVWNRPLDPELEAAAQRILERHARGLVRDKVAFGDSRVTINYESVGAQLSVAGDGKAAGFEIAGADQKFHPAAAEISPQKIVISSPTVRTPALARYSGGGAVIATGGQRLAPFLLVNYDAMGQDGAPVSIPLTIGPKGLQKGAARETTPEGEVYTCSAPGDGLLATLPDWIDGFVFNSPVISHPLFLRRGDAVGWSFDFAAGPGAPTDVTRVYFRFHHALTKLYWDSPNHVRTGSTDFSPRSVALALSRGGPSSDPNTGINNPKMVQSLTATLTPAGKGQKPRSFKIRNLSELTLIRAMLGGTLPEKVDLPTAAPEKAVESPEFVIENIQIQTLPVLHTDEEGAREVATMLYGVADIPATDRLQVVAPLGENIGAVLMGNDAAKFSIVGENSTEDGKGLRLVGPDRKPGLGGGPTPERETFSIRFAGGGPGTYHATLRVVTQAANKGRLSRGGPGEPPIHLYYQDIPVSVTVSP